MHVRALACVFLTACVADDPDRNEAFAVVPEGPHRAEARASGPMRAPALASAGWIDRLDGPITPWCGAVLVAPDVAMTSARCVVGLDPELLAVGFGGTRDRAYAIADVLLSDSTEPEHALAAVRLAEAVPDVVPADLGEASGGCDLTSVAYRFVERGDPGARWLWSGCLVGKALLAETGAPNCHGDLGAAAFDASGALIGIAVDAAGDGCADRQVLATVADEATFFERALDLSRPVG